MLKSFRLGLICKTKNSHVLYCPFWNKSNFAYILQTGLFEQVKYLYCIHVYENMFVRDFVNFVLNTSPNLTNVYVKGYL